MSMNAGASQSNSSASGMLRSFAERIVRLKGEIKNLQQDVKEVNGQAKGQGFDSKALAVVVKRMMEDDSEKAARQETEALADVYLASLGMLDGTPLGDATRRRADDPLPPDPATTSKSDDGADDDGDAADGDGNEPMDDAEPPTGAMSQDIVDAARVEGEEAAAAGAKVFANPYVAGDPRRAAWDEGWCRGTGSDGMDLPAAFRRKPKAPSPDKRAGGGH